MFKSAAITFDEMSNRYGEVTAYDFLEQIERAAGISPRSMLGIPPEQRLSVALRKQDQSLAA